jgi:hypothetical protein
MSWDDLKSIWRGCTPAAEMSQEEIMSLLQGRSHEIRRRIKRRLREEAGYYVALLGFAITVSFARPSWAHLTYPILSCVTLGVLIGTLHHHARRLRSVDLEGNLRQTLQSQLATLDRATRAYMQAYLFVILAHFAVLDGAVILLRRDRPALIALTVAASLAGVAFSWWSGRHYLESRFGTLREQLARCLAELD